MPKPLTLVMPYYENPGMLRKHLETWAQYPARLRQLLSVIIVDDGSPRFPAFEVLKEGAPSYLRLFRIKVDVRWNWIACRNLAMAQLETKWALMTDIDHLLPVCTLTALTREKHNTGTVYRLSRKDAPDGTPYKPHPNTWFLTGEMFERIGGYDERFSGFYGSDADFRERARKTASDVIMLSDWLMRYPREVIPDASTTNYGRKEQQDKAGIAAARERIAREGPPPLRMSFPWEQLI